MTNYTGLSGPPGSNVMAVAAGTGHDLALMSNGTVVAWGLTNLWPTSSNALAFQSNLTGVKAIACGWNHNVALLSNGVVEAWGLSATNLAWNLTNVPGDLTNAVAIAAFGLHSLALRTNGTVEAWGYSPDGETNVPAGLTNVVAIAAGGLQSLALQASGATVIWGAPGLTNIPPGLNAAKTIAGGFAHNLILQSDLLTPIIFAQPTDQFAPAGSNVTFSAQGESLAGIQYQWQFDGVNVTGATNASLTLTNVQATNNGSYQVIVSTSAGSLNSSIATFTLVLAPQIVAISLAANSTNWVTDETEVSVTVNAAGQALYPLHYLATFHGTTVGGTVQGNQIVQFMVPHYDLSSDGNLSLVITNAAGSTTNMTWNFRGALPGEVVPWGDDDSGQCDQVYGLTNSVWIAAGYTHSTAITENGAVAQWGEYWDGDLVSPPASTNYVASAAGLDHDIGLLSNGGVVTWGWSGADANYVPTNLPPAQAVACGWYHNVALLTNGSVAAWGLNYAGVTNVPPALTNANAVTAIAANYLHSLALTSSNTVVAWGYDGDGSCDVPQGLTNGQTNVVAIAAGEDHSLALTSNGTVVAWGDNSYGQCTVPAGLSNVMAIAAGRAHSLALKNDGTFVAWGDNNNGQVNVPNVTQYSVVPGTSSLVTNTIAPSIRVKMIAAGGDHNLAAIFNPWVQYQINVAQDLLLIYNSTNNSLSSNECAYYMTHRPLVGNANTLGINCPTNESFGNTFYTNYIVPPIQNWLAAHPTKRPQYVILFQDLPAWLNGLGNLGISLQMDLNTDTTSNYLPVWSPFVTSLNMNGTNGAADCLAYIDKLAYFGSNYSPGHLIISASAGGYGNTNWYFDFAPGIGSFGTYAEQGVTNADPSASVFGSTFPVYITKGTNVAGFFSGGFDDDGGDTNMFVDGTIRFWGNSSWYIMATSDSFSGERDDQPVSDYNHQACFLSWFATNSFGGTNYLNTPVGAVSYVLEPSNSHVNHTIYFGDWTAGRTFAICAWQAGISYQADTLQVIGDPFVRK